MAEPSDEVLRERIAEAPAASTLDDLVGYVVECVNDASAYVQSGMRDVIRTELQAHLAGLVADLDRLAAERGRFRSAWLNARYRAEGFAARYRYERKLCRDADVRGSKAIRAQLAAEADRDRLARKLAATVRVRNDAIEALDTMQIDRDRLRTRLDAYRASRERWMKSAYGDRHDSLAAHAALARVRALHVYNEDADYCNVCADGGDIRWPCATIAAIDGTGEAPEPDPAAAVIHYETGQTVRVHGWNLDADRATGALELDGQIDPTDPIPPVGSAVKVRRLGIPGRGALADILATIRLDSCDDTVRLILNTTITKES